MRLSVSCVLVRVEFGNKLRGKGGKHKSEQGKWERETVICSASPLIKVKLPFGWCKPDPRQDQDQDQGLRGDTLTVIEATNDCQSFPSRCNPMGDKKVGEEETWGLRGSEPDLG
jgi:hypothetical protein